MLSVPLELETALAGGFGQGFHPTVITICATVKDDRFNASCLRPFGDELAHHSDCGISDRRLSSVVRSPHILFDGMRRRPACADRHGRQ